MEFTDDEISIISNALLSRKLSLEKSLNGYPLPVFINRIFNDELSSISSLICRFADELNKVVTVDYHGD